MYWQRKHAISRLKEKGTDSGCFSGSSAPVKQQAAAHEFDFVLLVAQNRQTEEADEEPDDGQQEQDDEDGEPEV